MRTRTNSSLDIVLRSLSDAELHDLLEMVRGEFVRRAQDSCCGAAAVTLNRPRDDTDERLGRTPA